MERPKSKMESLLKLENVTKIFGGGLFKRHRITALENFSMTIDAERPSITALVGESGSGKTTLARLLLGLTRPTTGRVMYMGKDITTLTRRERKDFRRNVQVIFQDPFEVYNPFYKVDHALNLPIRKFKLAQSPEEARDLLENTLRGVGLLPEDTLGRYPHQLSGGQRQRIMVARALLMRPKVIVADEPVSMIDASLRATVLENLRELNRDFGISILYITHDLTTAYEISERIIVLYKGSVAEVGDVESVIQEPEHPYTRLLIRSIPMADPDQKWLGSHTDQDSPFADTLNVAGCKFANRCPHAMTVCVETAPPYFKTATDRATSCYLYEKSPVVDLKDMTRLPDKSPVTS